jgi:hypothetical protein
VGAKADLRLADLCRLAAATAARNGHEISRWSEIRDGSDDVRRGSCDKCGRRLDVRVGTGMTGMAGAALTEPCN